MELRPRKKTSPSERNIKQPLGQDKIKPKKKVGVEKSFLKKKTDLPKQKEQTHGLNKNENLKKSDNAGGSRRWTKRDVERLLRKERRREMVEEAEINKLKERLTCLKTCLLRLTRSRIKLYRRLEFEQRAAEEISQLVRQKEEARRASRNEQRYHFSLWVQRKMEAKLEGTAKVRKRWCAMTEEQKKIQRDKNNQRRALKRASETPEQREARKVKLKQSRLAKLAAMRAKESDAEREARLEKVRQARRAKAALMRATETPQQREARRLKIREANRIKRALNRQTSLVKVKEEGGSDDESSEVKVKEELEMDEAKPDLKPDVEVVKTEPPWQEEYLTEQKTVSPSHGSGLSVVLHSPRSISHSHFLEPLFTSETQPWTFIKTEGLSSSSPSSHLNGIETT